MAACTASTAGEVMKGHMCKEWGDYFLFLGSEWGMEGPHVTRYAGVETITYMGNAIAIEIEWDRREQRIFVLVVKLQDGQLPADYYVSEGEVVRIHLPKLLSHCAGGSPSDYVSSHNESVSQAEEYASLLRVYADCIVLSGDWMVQ